MSYAPPSPLTSLSGGPLVVARGCCRVSPVCIPVCPALRPVRNGRCRFFRPPMPGFRSRWGAWVGVGG